MRKAFPYIIGFLSLAAILFITFGWERERKLDERLTFNKNDKIPYGTSTAYRHLKYLFPKAAVSRNNISPEYWDSTYFDPKGRKAVIIITPQFVANEMEMNSLVLFAQKGNDVFISTRQSSITAQDFLKLRSSSSFEAFESGDSVILTLDNPPFSRPLVKSYPGRKFQSYLYKYDSSVTGILGRNHENDPVFIRLVTGDGNIYLHVAPIAFTNYFLLHKNNISYYNEALSVIPGDTRKLIWDEYFLYKQHDRPKENRGWLYVLFQYPAFKWGLLTAIFAVVLYVLLEMRRKQRFIPLIAKPKNDSLDFVKTIGRLYFEKNDHKNLVKKMGLYFLEHVRSRYHLSTGVLDNEFVKALHYKSGYPENELHQIISFISFADAAPGISDSQLAQFHKQMETFYKETR